MVATVLRPVADIWRSSYCLLCHCRDRQRAAEVRFANATGGAEELALYDSLVVYKHYTREMQYFFEMQGQI